MTRFDGKSPGYAGGCFQMPLNDSGRGTPSVSE